jgi:hypothetical protein
MPCDVEELKMLSKGRVVPEAEDVQPWVQALAAEARDVLLGQSFVLRNGLRTVLRTVL